MYMNGPEAFTPPDQDESPPDIAASSDCTCLRSCAPPIARPGPVSCWVERQSALPDHSSCQSIGRNACGVDGTSNSDHRLREACRWRFLESGNPWLREHAMPLALRSVRLQDQISRSRSSAGVAGPRPAPHLPPSRRSHIVGTSTLILSGCPPFRIPGVSHNTVHPMMICYQMRYKRNYQ